MRTPTIAAGRVAALTLVAVALAALLWGFVRERAPATPGVKTSVSGNMDIDTPVPDMDVEVIHQSGDQAPSEQNSRVVSITFPDGATLALSAKRLPAPKELPAGRLIDEYSALRKAAEAGSGSAAEALYRGLNSCRMAYIEERDLEAAISSLRSDRLVKLADGSPRTPIDPDEDVETAADSALRGPFEYCRGITAEQRAEAPKWLDVAARSGDLHAMRVRAALLGNTIEASQAWQAAWARGDRLALEFLGRIYSKGNPDQPGAAPDYVRAYAYSFLNVQLLEQIYADSPPGYFRGLVGRHQARLAEQGGLLNPQQHDQALALAQEVLAANPNCCFVN